jgi:hypothetical protein
VRGLRAWTAPGTGGNGAAGASLGCPGQEELQFRSGGRGAAGLGAGGQVVLEPQIWIKFWNANARPFKWTKTADQIIDRICRYCSRISGPAD